jgi:hypothetical protein
MTHSARDLFSMPVLKGSSQGVKVDTEELKGNGRTPPEERLQRKKVQDLHLRVKESEYVQVPG